MSSLLAFWRRRVGDLSQLAIWKVLERRETRRIAEQQPAVLAMAVERCLGCTSASRCRAELEDFCPNIMYFRHLEAMKRHAPKQDLLSR